MTTGPLRDYETMGTLWHYLTMGRMWACRDMGQLWHYGFMGPRRNYVVGGIGGYVHLNLVAELVFFYMLHLRVG